MRPHALPTAALAALLIALAAGLPARAVAQPASFTDVTTPEMMDNFWGEGVAWGDYDGDGDLDLLVSNEGQLLRLFRNDGGGVLTLVSPAAFAPGNWTGIAWGDYDNDGDIDLFAAEAERPKHLFRNDGGGVFTDMVAAIPADSSHVHGVTWVDYDQDGDVDLFYACAPSVFNNPSPVEKLLRNDGGVFVNVTPAAMLDAQYGRGCSWADYDDDGDPDLCIANFGFSRIYRNDGGGAFTDVTSPPVSIPGHAGGVAWGDYDNDGDFDLFIAKAFSATSKLYRNDAATFVDVTSPVFAPGDTAVGCQWGDYDNDGDLDLFVGNFGVGPCHLYRNDGGAVFTDVTNPALANRLHAIGMGWADYDGDGDLDLYVTNNFAEPDRLLRNDLANGNHWLQLDLVGVQSNRSGIDARVDVWTGGSRQIRRVDGGGGYNSQNTLRLHSGLGAATIVDSIRIRWPSGIIQHWGPIAVDQVLTIVERDATTGVGPAPGRPRLRLLASGPNPFRSSVAFRWDLTGESDVKVAIVDLHGRGIRMLVDRERLAPGRHERQWDGRDAAGNRVAPGVYFVRFETPGFAAQRRIVRLE